MESHVHAACAEAEAASEALGWGAVGGACDRAEADALVLVDSLLNAARLLYALSPADVTTGVRLITGLCPAGGRDGLAESGRLCHPTKAPTPAPSPAPTAAPTPAPTATPTLSEYEKGLGDMLPAVRAHERKVQRERELRKRQAARMQAVDSGAAQALAAQARAEAQAGVVAIAFPAGPLDFSMDFDSSAGKFCVNQVRLACV